MNIFRSPWLISLFLFFCYSTSLGNSVNIRTSKGACFFSGLTSSNISFSNAENSPTRYGNDLHLKITGRESAHKNNPDSLPKTKDVAIIIPFVYKQSALNYAASFKTLDSVVGILLSDDSIKLSIDGYSYMDEGSANICYWLSLNRALVVKYYVVGRGVDSTRILSLNALSSARSIQRKEKKEPVDFNCTAELILKYPIPPPPEIAQDTDEDGITDKEDSCINEYGDRDHNGCPDKNAIIVPFAPQQSSLFSTTYMVMDSIVEILRNDPSITISIEGHAYKKEGVEFVCERLAKERADIVRRYMLTRGILASRIESIKSFSDSRPINAGRNPWEIARNSRAEIYLVHH